MLSPEIQNNAKIIVTGDPKQCKDHYHSMKRNKAGTLEDDLDDDDYNDLD